MKNPIFAGSALLAALLLSTGPLRAQTKIPASAETAKATLTASPRHGEWADVPLARGSAPGGSAAKIRTWVVYPERRDKAPVVIVIHEIFGLTDWVRAVTVVPLPDGRTLLATGSDDETVRLWDPVTGMEVAEISLPDAVSAVAGLPHNRLAVTTGHHTTVLQVNLDTLPAHTTPAED